MSLLSAFKTDKKKEATGFWFEDTGVINDDETTPGFLLARASASNPKFAKGAEAIGKKFKRQLETDSLSNEVARTLNKALFLDTILLDWRNVWLPTDDDSGTEHLVPYSRENADKLFDLLPDLYELLEGEAKKLSNFRDAEIENDAKN